MSKSNQVFLGCNYSNQKVKNHFDRMKVDLEKKWPLRVVLIDKQKGIGASEIWKRVRDAIEESALCIFDVSANRPNVILELGYALAIKDTKNIVITVDKMKPRKQRKAPAWLLTDIAHLDRGEYKQLKQLDKIIEENLERVPAMQRFNEFLEEVMRDTAAGKIRRGWSDCPKADQRRGRSD